MAKKRNRKPAPTAKSVMPGERYGKLIVIRYDHTNSARCRCYLCACDCGGEKVAVGKTLKSGATTTCGCGMVERAAAMRRTLGSGNVGNSYRWKHGHAKVESRTYKSWQQMLARCRNQNHHAYKDYGGRGITVCARWQGDDGFINFLDDMGERPEGLTLDRTNNEGNYEPGNCRWATWSQQNSNRRSRRRGEAV